jgi:hypothetical protein
VVDVGIAQSDADFAGKNLTGKICLAQRGGTTFYWQKVENCTKAGAAAVVVMNR